MMPRPAPFAWEEGYTSRLVKEEEVLGVLRVKQFCGLMLRH